MPNTFLIWSGLWAISAAIGRKAWNNRGYFKVYPNMYIVLTGPPATKKGTACNMAAELLNNMEGIQLGPNMTTQQALIEKMSRNKKDYFIFHGDKIQHSSLAIMSPEWANLMGEQDKPFCNALCELYDCNEKFDKWTKTQGDDYIKNVYLTMLAGSTVKQITDCLPASTIGGGFTSRIIFVVENETKNKKVPLPFLTDKELAIQKKLIQDLQDINLNIIGEFNFTEGGEKFFIEWYMNRKEKLALDDKFSFYLDRKPIHVIKLSMLLSASRDNLMRIGAGEIADSLKLLDRIEPRMPEALGGVGLSLTAPVTSLVMEKLRVYGKLTEKQLQYMLWRDANKTELRDILGTLMNMDPPLIRRDDDGNFVWIERK